MASVRDIMNHVEIESAERLRICHRHKGKHGIAKGEKCLVVHEESGSKKNYCVHSAMEILAKARDKLAALERDVQS
jgi:hypothetical protein